MKDDDTVNQIISLFFTTSRLICKQSKGKNRPDFLSFLQIKTLDYVKKNKEPLMKEVAGFLSVTPASASPLIDKLVRSGMLKRCFNENDRRSIRLLLTLKGKKMLKREFKKASNQMRKVLMKLNKKEQKDLINIFQKLQNAYKK